MRQVGWWVLFAPVIGGALYAVGEAVYWIGYVLVGLTERVL